MLPNRPKAPPQRDQYSFGQERPQDAAARRSEGEAQSDFPRAVGGARGEEAAQIGACGQENQNSKQHHSCHEASHPGTEHVAG